MVIELPDAPAGLADLPAPDDLALRRLLALLYADPAAEAAEAELSEAGGNDAA